LIPRGAGQATIGQFEQVENITRVAAGLLDIRLVHHVGPQHILGSRYHGLAVVPEAVIKDDSEAGFRQHLKIGLLAPAVRVESCAASLELVGVIEVEH
jgi:hypothetical protein